jgi:hypothetical protein
MAALVPATEAQNAENQKKVEAESQRIADARKQAALKNAIQSLQRVSEVSQLVSDYREGVARTPERVEPLDPEKEAQFAEMDRIIFERFATPVLEKVKAALWDGFKQRSLGFVPCNVRTDGNRLIVDFSE